MQKTGDDYFDSDHFRKMLKSYEEMVKGGPFVFVDADDLTDMADYYRYIGERDKAEQAVAMALRIHPGATLPLVYRIHDALDEGDENRAWELLAQISDKSDLEYVFAKAEIYIATNDLDSADKVLLERFKQASDEQEINDFAYDAAKLYIDYNISDRAMEWSLRSAGEDSDEFKELTGRILMGMEQYDQSEKIFNELIDHNPYSTRYWNALSNVQFMKNDTREAISSSEYALAIDPDNSESVLNKAFGLYELGNYEEAQKYYNRFSKLCPDDGVAEQMQGNCLFLLNRYQEALIHFDKADQLLAPDDEENRQQLITQQIYALWALGKKDEARKKIERMPDVGFADDDVHLMRGHLLLDEKNGLRAIGEFSQAMAGTSDPQKVVIGIFTCYLETENYSAAYQIYERFKKHFPEGWDHVKPYVALCCLHLNGHEQEFIEMLKDSAEKYPDLTRIVFNFYFPEELDPSDYYEYVKKKLNEKKQ